MNKASILFCSGVLLATLGLSAVAIPYASISDEQLAKAKSSVSADSLGEVDLGGYGKVAVKDLLNFYIESPPTPKTAAAREVRFEGC